MEAERGPYQDSFKGARIVIHAALGGSDGNSKCSTNDNKDYKNDADN